MSPITILSVMVVYFGILILIANIVGKDSTNEAFFLANRKSKWYMVAFGMIGVALSGVTFISVPGEVGSPSGEQFKYFQFVIGNAIGFLIIAKVLLPLYYRLNLVSIYQYIEQRMGIYSHKTAALIFLVSRTIGSAFRLYLVVIVLQRFVFDYYGIPFWMTVLISLGLIFAYTYKGGLKTIIITDLLQTFFLVSSLVFTIYFVCKSMDYNIVEAFEAVKNSNYSKIFFYEDFITNRYHFVKQILGGIFVTLAMVGLDQDLMQKNLSCKNISEAQKNMLSFTVVFVIVNLLFLSVGALLYMYANQNVISVPTDLVTWNVRTDLLFPEIAFNHFSIIPSIIFLLGLTAATFATTDSALTALTTSFCVDFLKMDRKKEQTDKKMTKQRYFVHISFAFLMFLVIMVFNAINDASVVSMIFRVASYTYGPLLGMYAFGLFLKNRKVNDKITPIVCLLAPFLTFLIAKNSEIIFGNYVFDVELIILNGLITLIGLLTFSNRNN